MRRRITWLVAATTSAVVVSFVVPLCLLVRTLAEDRAMAGADQEARNVALLVASLPHDPDLPALVTAASRRGAAHTSVLLDDGRVLGAPDPGMAADAEVRRAQRGEAFAVRADDGGRVLLPVVVDTGTEVVRSSVSGADLHRGVASAWAAIIGLGVALMLVALLVADRLGRRVSRPLRGVAGTAHRLREGDLGARAQVEGTEETQELARALNGLADRIHELLVAERASVADLSHRLRTPATALRLDAEAVADPALSTRLQEHIAALQQGIDAIVSEARRPVLADVSPRCDVVATVRDRIAFWQVLAEDEGRPLTVRLPESPVTVAMATGEVRDVLDILVDNVFAHTAEGVAFSVAVELSADKDEVCLTVVDAGGGAARVGDRAPGQDGEANADAPGDRPGRTRFGLGVVRRAAAAAGGALHVDRAADGGLRARVRLPVLAT